MPEREGIFAQPLELSAAEEGVRLRLWSSFEKAGQQERLSECLIRRLEVIEKHSRFNEDARKVEQVVDLVHDYLESKYALNNTRLILSKEKRREGRIAALLHDVGKAGPAEATPEQQEAVVKVFALEHIKDQKLPLEEAVRSNYDPDEAGRIIGLLEGCGIDPNWTMREFWDKHALWTDAFLENQPEGLSEHTRNVAGLHHANRGIIPERLKGKSVPFQAKIIGTLEDYVDALRVKILTVADEYEAQIRRNHSGHEEAIGWVRNNLKQFADDPLINKILEAVDKLGKDNKYFRNLFEL